MFSFHRLMKLSYILVLGTAVLVLSRPAPVQAQRTIAYSFLPGQLSFILGRGMLAGFSNPLNSFMAAQMMLMQAGMPLTIGLGGGLGANGSYSMMGAGGGAAGMGGGGMMGNMMGGGMMGMRGGMGGMGGMGGFAGKGFGGFNGKKPI